MRFFIDTAKVEDIKKANDMGVICGVTTNPSLIAKEGRDFVEVIKEIASIVDGPISGEVKATTVDAEGMIKEGREIAAIHPNMVVKIPMTVEGLKAMKVRGWNVSMPNKTTIVKYLDHLTPVAKMGQAVNTVINDDGVLTGTTTDGVGFIKVLKESNLDPIGKKITIVGAGGAVTAIEIQAALDGVAEISIFNRKDEFYNQALINCENINENTQSKAKVFD